MAISIVDEYYGLRLQLPIDGRLEAALAIQHQRAIASGDHSFVERLRDALNSTLDWDLQPPTAEQLACGLYIASALSLPLASECIRFRGSMEEFFQRHSKALADHQRSWQQDD